tara:strand:- start:347 stop:1420 length:1074 start_codon:yes stop_codon:yes gene_type:complete
MAAYTTIDDPSAFFQTVLWTGNTSAPRSITNDGNSNLQPDWVWGKNRTTAGTDHEVYDSNRGTGTSYNLKTSSTAVEGTSTTYGQLTAFDTDGFTVNAGGSNDDFWNENGSEFVAWQWKCAGGTTSTNNDGAVTSTVQVNSTAGFSILTYTMNSNSNETVGHGLGVAPDIVITKARQRGDSNGFWAVYTTKIDGSLDYLKLNTTDAKSNSSLSAPTSTVFTGAGSSTASYRSFVAYCFKSIQGYSKFGKYTGNGNTNGPFIYTGFKPAFVILKGSSASGSWYMLDSKRDVDNVANHAVEAQSSAAEYTNYNFIDMLSNGFKLRLGTSEVNTDGNSYIYMAFAENPFVTSTGIPTTAR